MFVKLKIALDRCFVLEISIFNLKCVSFIDCVGG